MFNTKNSTFTRTAYNIHHYVHEIGHYSLQVVNLLVENRIERYPLKMILGVCTESPEKTRLFYQERSKDITCTQVKHTFNVIYFVL